MAQNNHSSRRRQRRSILAIGFVALLYPLLKFTTYKIPRKRRKIEVNTDLAPGDYFVHQEFILFNRDGRDWAIGRKCTHLGCKVNFHEVEGYLECPCHQSRFSRDGKVLHGPAKVSLATYEVEKRDEAPYYIITV